MSRSLGNTIADSLDQGLRYGESLLANVNADQFARFAAPGGEAVVSNHPAFVYGHLTLYGPQMLSNIGADTAAAGVPSAFDAVFSKEAVCADDPDGKIYPPMDEVIAAWRKSYSAASAALREVDDAVFAAPEPRGGGFAERFPTVGSSVAFYAGGHTMLHLGQMSAWRRMAGLGSA